MFLLWSEGKFCLEQQMFKCEVQKGYNQVQIQIFLQDIYEFGSIFFGIVDDVYFIVDYGGSSNFFFLLCFLIFLSSIYIYFNCMDIFFLN